MLSLSLPTAQRPNFIHAPAAPRLQLHRAGSARRGEVEAFISAVYRERYGAELQHFAPVLVSLHDEHGECVAAAGYRAADSGPLFLERYLPARGGIAAASIGRAHAAARAHRRGRPPCGGACRRRPPADPAARPAPGGPGFRMGGQHADAGAAQPVRAHGRGAAGAGRGRPCGAGRPGGAVGQLLRPPSAGAGRPARCRAADAGAAERRAHEAGAGRRPACLERRAAERRPWPTPVRRWRAAGARVLATVLDNGAGLRRAGRGGAAARHRACAAAAVLHARRRCSMRCRPRASTRCWWLPPLAAAWPGLQLVAGRGGRRSR